MRAGYYNFNVYNSEAEADRDMRTPWGNSYFEITREDIQALLDGKTLAGCVASEYGLFISLEKGD